MILENGRKFMLNDAPALIVQAVATLSTELPKSGHFSMEMYVTEGEVKLIPKPSFVFKRNSPSP